MSSCDAFGCMWAAHYCACQQEKKRINKEGELVVTSTATRSQA